MHSQGENRLGRAVLVAMIPVNVFMLAWVWFGRAFFGAMGWYLLVMLYVLPFLFLGLLATTLIGFLGSDKPRRLTQAQAVTHLALWGFMLGFGFFLVDFGDTEDSARSAFTQVVGTSDTLVALSTIVAMVCAGAAVMAWLALLVLLIVQKRRTSVLPPPAAPDAHPSVGITTGG